MKYSNIHIGLILSLVCFMNQLTAQSKIVLEDILALTIENSIQVKLAKNDKELALENYKFFRTQLKPFIGIEASLPNYSKTSSPIIQQNGTIAFQSIRQANSSISGFVSQVLPSTGGSLFLNSNIQRFDDFSFSDKQYNGIPIRLGINQSIFGFNPWKFDKKINAQLLAEANIAYNINIEESLGRATDLYFNILIAEQNLEIAKTNQLVNEKLLYITDERFKLGKVSKDQQLQLEIELNNAKLAVSQAESEKEQATASLYTFLGKQIPSLNNSFTLPKKLEISTIDMDRLLSSYQKNRPEILAFQRQLTENKRDRAKTKSDFGFQADIQASIGLARGASTISTIYSDPFDEQQFNLSLFIPLLDWGKKNSAVKQIKIKEESIKDNQKQFFLELENSIRQMVQLLNRMQSEISIMEEIMNKANERFNISNERYVLGNIDITNLTLAQREKDQTKRNYINSLKSFWTTYYSLRALTGFDVINNQPIHYTQF